jgi:hypothetical protein
VSIPLSPVEAKGEYALLFVIAQAKPRYYYWRSAVRQQAAAVCSDP